MKALKNLANDEAIKMVSGCGWSCGRVEYWEREAYLPVGMCILLVKSQAHACFYSPSSMIRASLRVSVLQYVLRMAKTGTTATRQCLSFQPY